MESVSTIRNSAYDYNRKLLLENGEDLDNWRKYPYTAFKSRVYIEISTILVFLLQYTGVHPNHITMVYVFAGVLGGVLLSTNNDVAILIALLIFLFKGVFDWSDGLLARLTNRCSDEGAVLDPWGALVNSFGFLIGIGFYLFNRSDDVTYIYMMVFIIFLRGIDARQFAYLQTMNDVIEHRVAYSRQSIGSYSESLEPKIIGFNRHGWVARFGRMVMSILDDRARSVDFVCLIILFEVMAGKLLITPILYWIYVIKYSLIFGGGFYILYYKKLPSQLKGIVFGTQEGKGKGAHDSDV